MWVIRVVVDAPCCRLQACIFERSEPIRIEQFLANAVVERFAESVV